MPACGLTLYSAAANEAAGTIIRRYSTSFSLATRLLDRQMREDISNLYAVVRIADEIVDGAAHAAGLSNDAVSALLDEYEESVCGALDRPFHPDPVLHAFASTAAGCGLDRNHLRAFFDSMRQDLSRTTYTRAELDRYIYGSAEVIGLMCVAIFVRGRRVSAEDRARMDEGARALGAAFQKINFLRDRAADEGRLGRRYYPDLDRVARTNLVAEIRSDLQRAEDTLVLLPSRPRLAVTVAMNLFRELLGELEDDPGTRRVRLSAWRKGRVLISSLR